MKISFLNISDLHMDKKKAPDIQIVIDALLRDLNRLNPTIDFILFNGDLINNGSQGLTGDNEYHLAKSSLIEPLISKLGLDMNKFFLVPGNHDVNRSKINPYIDRNLTDKFNTRDELNRFLDEFEMQDVFFSRLGDFNLFVKQIHVNNPYLVRRNNLFSTFIFEKNDFKIGIACLNSAWGSYGGNEDYGKLLVGERQVDFALNDLEKADLKIVMFHHPLDWLKEFDKESIYRILINNFNFVFQGHLHTHLPNQIIYDQANTIFYRCSSLFDGRKLNGYTIITYDTETGEAHFKLREYYDQRREFDKALSISEEGEMRFFKDKNHSIIKNEILVIKKQIEIKSKIKSELISKLNKKLISAISPDTLAPKELKHLYVPPLLSKEPESYRNTKDNNFEDLQEILQQLNNCFFVGRKEIGKTTLLNYICYYFLTQKFETPILPVLINFRDLPNGNNIIEKSILNFLQEYDVSDVSIDELLSYGEVVLLFDNFHFNDVKKIKKLNLFAQKHPKIKLIFVTDEDVLETIHVKERPEVSFEYETYYLYSYTRNQTRLLIENWFQDQNINCDIVLDRIVNIIKQIGLPRNPLNISLLLSIIEKQSNYIPINEATLVDRFTEFLLEKLKVEDVKYETYDYAIKGDYLSYLVSLMVEKGQFYLEALEFEQATINYFREKGLDAKIDKFKEIFFKKGILILEQNKVSFRFNCFFELYTAKYMLMDENKEFRDYIFSQEKYLSFKNEIVYYAGLTRRNTYNFLAQLEERLIKSFEKVDEMVDVSKLSELPIINLLSKTLGQKELQDRLSEFSLSDQEKDAILDSNNNSVQAEEKDRVSQEKSENQYYIFMENLLLYSRVIRNLELEKIDLKKHGVKISINRFTKLLGFLYKVLLDKIKEIIINEDLDDDDLFAEFEYILKTGLPLVMQHAILECLGSPKLNSVLLEVMEEVETDFEKFMIISLYSDLRLDNYILKMGVFLKGNKSKIIKETALLKLVFYRLFFSLSYKESDQLNKLIVELTSDNTLRKNIYDKGRRIETLKKDMLLKQPKEEFI